MWRDVQRVSLILSDDRRPTLEVMMTKTTMLRMRMRMVKRKRKRATMMRRTMLMGGKSTRITALYLVEMLTPMMTRCVVCVLVDNRSCIMYNVLSI